MSKDDKVACEICGQNHPFELPPELLRAALANKLVIFAGAGISTESRQVFPDTFSEVIAEELGQPTSDRNFPQLMTQYEEKFGRAELLQQIRRRFEYMKGFPELLTMSTRFHSELSTAFFLNQIVTTNWDTFFEDYADATPIVIPTDYAFWDLGGRQVFKLHGSINNLSTIVATEYDYDRCYRRLRSGAIGGTLKHLLATKRVVFIGYSFGDPDLNRLLRFMRRELNEVLPRSFVVTPHGYDGHDFPPDRVLKTDGTFFIRKLKDAAIDLNLMRPDTVYRQIARLAARVRRAHARVARNYRATTTPSVIHTLAYQDGLRHAFDRIEALRKSGHYSDPHSTHLTLTSYERLRKQAIRQRQYFDGAYIEGYQNGLMALETDADTLDSLPLYFVWGSKRELVDFDDFVRELSRAPSLHKAATAEAERSVGNLADDLIVSHRPFVGVEPG